MALSALSPSHVTLNLDIICHAPAKLGTVIQIISMSTVVGSRVLGTRCEVSREFIVDPTSTEISHDVCFPPKSTKGNRDRDR